MTKVTPSCPKFVPVFSVFHPTPTPNSYILLSNASGTVYDLDGPNILRGVWKISLRFTEETGITRPPQIPHNVA